MMIRDPRNPNAVARAREQSFMNALIVELNKLDQTRAYRRNAGSLPDGKGGRVKVGVTGQCDIWLLAWPGIHVEIECKVEPGVLTAAQVGWRDLVVSLGFVHIVATARAGERAADAAAFWAGYIDEAVLTERARLRGLL